MQIEERRARRAQRRAGRQPLNAAGDEQPRRGIGKHEQDGRRHQGAERDQHDGPPAYVVRDAPEEQQAGQDAEPGPGA
jgi:hypothetical protein